MRRDMIELSTASGPSNPTGARRWTRWLSWQLPIAVAALLTASFAPLATSSSAAPPPPRQAEGLVCATGSTADFYHPPTAPLATNPSFVLTAQDGYITTPDGNSIYMWGYANGGGAYQDPGPVLCVNEGDTVTITLRNTLPVATSIQFPGLTGVQADGAPTQPSAATGSLATAAGADTGSAPNAGDPAKATKVTYSFVADHPGTFVYESGTDPELQVQMGLVGAIVVRPRVGNPCLTGAAVAAGTVCTPSSHVYDDAGATPGMATDPVSCTKPAGGLACFSEFNPRSEYLHLLSEVDPMLHAAAESGNYDYEMTAYKARYFFINGRSFPDTVSPNLAAHIPAQPYGALVHIQPRNTDASSPDYNPDPALVRYVNAGPVDYPFHPHSNNERQIGFDAQPMINPTGAASPTDASVDRYSIVVPPGATIETEFAWVDQANWDPANHPINAGGAASDITVPDQQSRTEGQFWSGTPYLGRRADLSTGTTQYNQCGEMYQVAHSHALFQATNYGASMGGMLTMIRIDPPNSFAEHANCTTGN
jgi:FtsP/CotA-like multicopper oxidase with cupredoxin domain